MMKHNIGSSVARLVLLSPLFSYYSSSLTVMIKFDLTCAQKNIIFSLGDHLQHGCTVQVSPTTHARFFIFVSFSLFFFRKKNPLHSFLCSLLFIMIYF